MPSSRSRSTHGLNRVASAAVSSAIASSSVCHGNPMSATRGGSAAGFLVLVLVLVLVWLVGVLAIELDLEGGVNGLGRAAGDRNDEAFGDRVCGAFGDEGPPLSPNPPPPSPLPPPSLPPPPPASVARRTTVAACFTAVFATVAWPKMAVPVSIALASILPAIMAAASAAASLFANAAAKVAPTTSAVSWASICVSASLALTYVPVQQEVVGGGMRWSSEFEGVRIVLEHFYQNKIK